MQSDELFFELFCALFVDLLVELLEFVELLAFVAFVEFVELLELLEFVEFLAILNTTFSLFPNINFEVI